MTLIIFCMLSLVEQTPVNIEVDGFLQDDRIIRTSRAEKTFLVNNFQTLAEYTFDGELVTEIDIRAVQYKLNGEDGTLDGFWIVTGAYIPNATKKQVGLYALTLLRQTELGIEKRVVFFDRDNNFRGFGFVEDTLDVYFDQILPTKSRLLVNVFEKRYPIDSQHWFLQEVKLEERGNGGFNIVFQHQPFLRNIQSDKNLLDNFKLFWLVENEDFLVGIGQVDRRLTKIGQINERGLDIHRHDRVIFDNDIAPYPYPEDGKREGPQFEGSKKARPHISRTEWYYSFTRPTSIDRYDKKTYALSYQSPNPNYDWANADERQAVWEGEAPYALNIIRVDEMGGKVGKPISLDGSLGNLVFMLGTRDNLIYTLHQSSGGKFWIERHTFPK